MWAQGNVRRHKPSRAPTGPLTYDRVADDRKLKVELRAGGSFLSEEMRRPSTDEIAERLRTGKPLGSIEIQRLLDIDDFEQGGNDGTAESNVETG